MAVVVDEFGGLAGVVTMEDILEEILGPIRNENESEAFEIEVLAPGKWRVSGLLEVDAFREYCPSLEDVIEVDTMGGLFTMKLGYVPEAEETVLFGNLKLTSKIVGERRIKELLVQRHSPGMHLPKTRQLNEFGPWNRVLLRACPVISFFRHGIGNAFQNRRLRRRARQGDKSAASLMGYLDETESFLWTVLVGNTLANLMIVAPLLWALRALMPSYPWGSAILLVALLLILYAFCDLLPKLLYRHFPDQLTVASVRPYQLFHGLLSPLVFVVSGFADLLHRITGGKTLSARLFSNRDEMRQMMALSSQNLTIEETSMIDRVMDLKSRSLVSVMTPIHEVASLNAKDTIEHAVGVAREESLMRFPVFDLHDGQRVFMGVFLFKTLLHDWQQCRQEPVGGTDGCLATVEHAFGR